MKVGILGSNGKMGQELVSLLSGNEYPNLILQQKLDINTPWTALKDIDILIDFSATQATLDSLPHLIEFKKPAVIGTTGFSENQISEIKKTSQYIPILLSSNMSLGMNVLFELTQRASQLLPQFSSSILDIHHAQKKDAPSGTALKLKDEISKSRPSDSVTIESIRGGDCVGEHTVFFLGSGERIELIHRATDRAIFARGALHAAQWLVKQKTGLYAMKDVLS